MVFIRRSGGPSEGCDIVLCEVCANRRGINAGKGGLELNIDDLIGVGLDADRGPGRPAICPGCGLEFGTLRREGRLGCSACADAFHDELLELKSRGQIGAAEVPATWAAPATEPAHTAMAPGQGAIDRLRRELESALASEEYEAAARLRDELSRAELECSGQAPPDLGASAESASDFPFDLPSPASLAGPDDDVVLTSSARVYRNLVGLPFPGSPHGPSAPSRSLLLGKLLSEGQWRARTMSELGSSARRSLSERGLVPRGYAADDEAPVLSYPSFPGYALLDEGDHLHLRCLLPGLDVEAALGLALDAADRLGRGLDFARSPDIGWICARLQDCGLGCSLAATLHLPAIAAAGMRDRLFRALLAEGLAVRGFYSGSEDSAGSVYEIGLESSRSASPQAMAAAFSAALAKIVAAERRARAEISDRGKAALADAEGRAFGLTRYFGLTGAEEAASLLSVLRLAALRGSLSGVDHRALGGLLLCLGSASIALASGFPDLPSAGEQELSRARVVKEALAQAEYRIEEGA
jgi:protein arginine kinase